MAGMIKKLILWKLRLLSRAYLRFKNIEIIAITGSAGKTTAKVTLRQLLPSSEIYVPTEAYNTEFGVPLAIFREKVPNNPRNLIAWFTVFIKMLGKLFIPAPYHKIVLEFGADKPGDIDYLTSFAKPHISIVTTVLPAHLAGFYSVEVIAAEKARLVTCLESSDFAILNFENKYVKPMAAMTKARVKSFGREGADLVYDNVKFNDHGMVFDISWKGDKYHVNIPVAAPQLIPSYLSALLVGLLMGHDIQSLIGKLAKLTPERGRMNVILGVNGSVIIDDSYNSNPESAKAALRVLADYPGKRKIAVLGSMNELGHYTEIAHREVGELAAKAADEVIIIGDTAGKYMYPAVRKKKAPVKAFATARLAGEYLVSMVRPGDVILFKGSQNGVFAEEAVKYVLANSDNASELLVRQGPMWQNKKGKL